MRRTTSMIALAVAGVAAAMPAPSRAQTAPAGKAAESKPSAPDAKQAKAAAAAAAQKAYDAGTKAFENGKYKEAVAQLSTALAGGGLPSQQMAKALYYRGVANRKLNKPAQAMSDLTTAIWVSGGLSDADRAAAIDNRQAAYREAGLGDVAPGDVPPNRGVAASSPAASSPAAAAATPAVPAATASTSPNAAPGLDVAEATSAPAAIATPAAKPRPAARDEGVPNPMQSNEPSAPPQPTLAAAPAPAPEPAPPAASPSSPNMFEKAGNSISEAGSNVGNFFGNLFKSSPPPPAQPQTGLAAGPTPIEPQASASPVLTAANPDGIASAADGWGDTTEVKSAKGSRVSAAEPTAAGVPAAPFATTVSTGTIAPTAPAAKRLTGKYQLQVAAVRSRAEAEDLADRVRQQYADALGGREIAIDEAVIGNFGSFHRVRVGPYADAKEPGKFCSTLIKSGFDCLVVTQ